MSEDLLGRADTLMRRSRTFVAGHAATGQVDDGIPLLTEEFDLQALIAVPEPPDRTAEITAAVTAEVTQRVTEEVAARVTSEVTERVTAEVTASVTVAVTERVSAEVSAHVTDRVTAEVTDRVTAEVAERVARETTADVTHRVTQEVAAAARDEALQDARRASSDALTNGFGDLAGLIQSLIDDWSSTTLPSLAAAEMRSALATALDDAVFNATARIREQAVLDLRDSIAGEIEARCAAVTAAAASFKPSEGPDQPL